jgi:hypothetical protein
MNTMKKNKLNLKAFGKFIAIPVALILVSITVNSCKKDNDACIATPLATTDNTASEKSAKVDAAIEKAFKDLVVNVAVATNKTTVSVIGTGSNTFSNVAVNVNVYATPSANVVTWSNSAGSSFTLSSSLSTPSNGGTGFGQISCNGKTFNYNYVLCIKSSLQDSVFTGLFNGHGTDMRGVIAFEGDTANSGFFFKNMAAFFVDASAGDGDYDFINWNSSHFTSGNAIGKILDFSGVTNNTIAGIGLATPLFTSSGSVTVDSTSFTLSADAKVTDILSLTEYPVSGKISCK